MEGAAPFEDYESLLAYWEREGDFSPLSQVQYDYFSFVCQKPRPLLRKASMQDVADELGYSKEQLIEAGSNLLDRGFFFPVANSSPEQAERYTVNPVAILLYNDFLDSKKLSLEDYYKKDVPLMKGLGERISERVSKESLLSEDGDQVAYLYSYWSAWAVEARHLKREVQKKLDIIRSENINQYTDIIDRLRKRVSIEKDLDEILSGVRGEEAGLLKVSFANLDIPVVTKKKPLRKTDELPAPDEAPNSDKNRGRVPRNIRFEKGEFQKLKADADVLGLDVNTYVRALVRSVTPKP